MRKIPGIYVPIRGDYKQLQQDMGKARQIVTEKAHGISNALNNALSPDHVKKNLNAIVSNLSGLSRASQDIRSDFSKIGADLGDLRKMTGLTDAEFAKLQSRMLRTQAEKAQEKALRDIAKAANLTEREIRTLGLQMNVSKAQIDRVVTSTKEWGKQSQQSANIFGSSFLAASAARACEFPAR